jgi:hypothetical protein
MPDELPEGRVRIDETRTTAGAPRLRRATRDRIEVADLAVEPGAPVANTRGPLAEDAAVLGCIAAAKVDHHLDRNVLVVANDRQVGDADTRAASGM